MNEALREELELNIFTEEDARNKYCQHDAECRASRCMQWRRIIIPDVGPKGYCGLLSDPRMPIVINEILNNIKDIRLDVNAVYVRLTS